MNKCTKTNKTAYFCLMCFFRKIISITNIFNIQAVLYHRCLIETIKIPFFQLNVVFVFKIDAADGRELKKLHAWNCGKQLYN